VFVNQDSLSLHRSGFSMSYRDLLVINVI